MSKITEIPRVDDLREREYKVREGLRFIVKHLDDSMPIWRLGRWVSACHVISAKDEDKEQIFRKVYSEVEALRLFKAYNFLDCRIRAYLDVCTDMAPSVLFADLDRKQFKTVEEFELTADKTYNNFKEMLDARPTQMSSGNGYHFINPQFATVLEKTEMFKKFSHVSRDFLRFEEQFITNGMADPQHSNTLAFGNSVLRIPGSLNSKLVPLNEVGQIIGILPEAEVRVVNARHWDGQRPPIKPILPQFYIWQQAAVARKLDKQIEDARKYSYAKAVSIKYRRQQSGTKNTIGWIEKLLDTQLDDYRKYVIKFILAPYFMNIRGFSRQDAFDNISMWLNKCNFICRLRFNATRKTDEALDSVRDFLPQGRFTLKQKFPVLYIRLEEEGIVY
jgi:hypothetical protein